MIVLPLLGAMRMNEAFTGSRGPHRIPRAKRTGREYADHIRLQRERNARKPSPWEAC